MRLWVNGFSWNFILEMCENMLRTSKFGQNQTKTTQSSMLWVIGDLENSSFIPPDIYSFGFSGPFAYSRKAPASFAEPGRLFAYMNAALGEWIFVKFYIGDVWKYVEEIQIRAKSDKKYGIRNMKTKVRFMAAGDKSVLKALLKSTCSGTVQRECVVSFPFFYCDMYIMHHCGVYLMTGR